MIAELLIFIPVLAFLIAYGRILISRLSLPPGPFPWPIFGNLFQMKDVRPQETCLEWSKKYGPVFTVWFAHKPMIMITDFELMKDTFGKHGDQLTSRPRDHAIEIFTDGNYGIVMTNGDAWREQRRFALHALRNFGFGRNIMEMKVLAEAEKLSQRIVQDLDSKNQSVMNVALPIQYCVCNIISSVVLGQSFEKGDEKFEFLVQMLDEHFKLLASSKILMMNCFPWLRYVPMFGHFGMDDMKRQDKIFRNFFTEQVAEHKAQQNQYDEDEPSDFVAAYLNEMNRRKREGEDMSYFSEWQLVCTIADLWIAGLETTVTTLRWAILAMIKYPSIQKKIHEEIDTVLDGNRPPSMADRQNMPYTMATINEIQRWGNIVPINFARSNETDIYIGNFLIPKDTAVIPQISVLAIEGKVFPEPSEFRPERFLNEDGTLAKVYQLAPFSIGKRQCLGEGLARAELFLIFVHLIQKFEFSIVPGSEEPTTEPASGLTTAPQPYECLVKLRLT